MVKVLSQIMAEVLNSMVLPQRDNEYIDKSCYQAVHNKLEVSMVNLQSTMQQWRHMPDALSINLLNQVLHGAREVSAVKPKLQITAEVMNCVVLPQRDNEHLHKYLNQAVQDKFEVSRVMPVLQSMAEANMMYLTHHMTTEVIV